MIGISLTGISPGSGSNAGNAPVANLVLKSNAFTTSPWSAGTGFAANQTTSPDGTLDGWLGNSAVGATNAITQTMTGKVITTAQTMSIYVKQNDAPGFAFGAFDNTSSAFIFQVNAVWTSGVPVVTQGSGAGTIKVEPAANGFFRISITYIGGTAGHNLRMFLYPESAIGGNCTGKGNFFFGAQVANGGAAGRYTPNP